MWRPPLVSLVVGQPKQLVDVTQADDGDIQRQKPKDPSSVRPLLYTCKMVWHWMTGECMILSIFSHELPQRLRPGSQNSAMLEFKPWSWIMELPTELTTEFSVPVEIEGWDGCLLILVTLSGVSQIVYLFSAEASTLSSLCCPLSPSWSAYSVGISYYVQAVVAIRSVTKQLV